MNVEKRVVREHVKCVPDVLSNGAPAPSRGEILVEI